MIICISYGDEKYKKSRNFNLKTAIDKGNADKIIAFGPNDIDAVFYEKNKSILDQKRGNGYWLWKPYIIYKTLMKMDENDYLMYADAGSVYINKVQYLVDAMENSKQSIMCFQIGLIEKYYTKRDIFIELNCDTSKYTDSPQNMATFILIKNCEFARKFIKKWLDVSQNYSLITDAESSLGQNYDGFIENRHDQSLLSILLKKENIQSFKDPSQYGTSQKNPDILKISNYPVILYSHRGNNVDSWFKVYKKVFRAELQRKSKIARKIYMNERKTYKLYACLKKKILNKK